MKSQKFILANLNCPSCAADLERGVRKLSGVQEVNVGFATGTLSVTYDDSVISTEDIQNRVKQFGVTVINVMPA